MTTCTYTLLNIILLVIQPHLMVTMWQDVFHKVDWVICHRVGYLQYSLWVQHLVLVIGEDNYALLMIATRWALEREGDTYLLQRQWHHNCNYSTRQTSLGKLHVMCHYLFSKSYSYCLLQCIYQPVSSQWQDDCRHPHLPVHWRQLATAIEWLVEGVSPVSSVSAPDLQFPDTSLLPATSPWPCTILCTSRWHHWQVYMEIGHSTGLRWLWS